MPSSNIFQLWHMGVGMRMCECECVCGEAAQIKCNEGSVEGINDAEGFIMQVSSGLLHCLNVTVWHIRTHSVVNRCSSASQTYVSTCVLQSAQTGIALNKGLKHSHTHTNAHSSRSLTGAKPFISSETGSEYFQVLKSCFSSDPNNTPLFHWD